MELVILAQQLELGGVEKCIIMLANSLVKRGYEVRIVSVLKSQNIIDIDKRVNVVYLLKKSIRKESLIDRIYRKKIELNAIRKFVSSLEKCVVISTRNEYSTILSHYGNSMLFKIAMLHNEYNMFEKYDFIYKYDNIDYFVHLNDVIRDEIAELMKKNKYTKLITIPNFIEPRPKQIEKRNNYVVSVGGMRYVKGFDRLIDAWKIIEKRNSNWKLIIVGDGPEYENIKNKIDELDLNKSVILKGKRSNDEVFNIMHQSKIYALPSRKEAFGFVIIEAMQSGLPVVAFDVRTGPKTIVSNDIDGFLVSDEEVDVFAERLEKLMRDDWLRKCFSENAIIKSKKYETDNVIDLWEQVIKIGLKKIESV